jgi:4-amino-4-deoxy-L-arabinose transferase-like glycosyltransferase
VTVDAAAPRPRRIPALLVGCWLVVAAVYLHNALPHLTMLPRINVDEPWLIERAYQLASNGSPRQPMFLLDRAYLLQPGQSLLLAPWIKLFGVGLWQARLLAVLLGLGTLTAVYVIGETLFGPAVGIAAAVLLATDSNFLGAYRMARTDAPAVCFAAASLAALAVGERTGRARWLFAAGFCAGVAMLCHGNCYWVVLVAFAWLLVSHGARLFVRRGPWAYAGGFALVFGPYVALIAARWREFNDQLHIFAIQRVPSLSLRTIAATVADERHRYHDWYFGLVTQEIANPLLWVFQIALVLGAISLIASIVRGRASAPERILATIALVAALVFAGFIPNKALIYMPHLLIGYALVAGWWIATTANRFAGTRAAPVGAGVIVFLAAEAFGAIGFYEFWYARMRDTTSLVPYEQTETTLRALVPPGRKYLFASPTFWLAFYDNPDVTFIADTAAGPYRTVVEEGWYTRRSLFDFPADRPIYALVDDDEWKTLLLDPVNADRTWRTTWSAYLADSCALRSAAFSTAHGTLALYGCTRDGRAEPRPQWYVEAGQRLTSSTETWAATPSSITRWPLYKPDTTVVSTGSEARVTAPNGGGVYADIPVREGTPYLVSFDVSNADAGDLATLVSVTPAGLFRHPQWVKLIRPDWFPGGAIVRPTTPTLRLYLFSESGTDFRVRGVHVNELRPAAPPR